jgi:hypothetical protein
MQNKKRLFQNFSFWKSYLRFSICLLLISFFVLSAFTACSTKKPMTREVAREVERDLSVMGLRFYLSENITLDRVTLESSIDYFEDRRQEGRFGFRVRRETTSRTFSLSSRTSGRLNSNGNVDIDGPFDVTFERIRSGDPGPEVHYPTIRFVPVLTIHEDKEREYRFYFDWISVDEGVLQRDPKTGNWRTHEITGRPIFLFEGEYYTIYCDTRRGQWLAHIDNGRRIIRYNSAIYTVKYNNIGVNEPFLRYREVERSDATVSRMRGVR